MLSTRKRKWIGTIALGLFFFLGLLVGHTHCFPYGPLQWGKNQILSGLGLSPGLQVKADFNDDTLFKRKVKCPSNPITLLAFGQSNSGNHLLGARTALDTNGVTNFFQGNCYKLEDPVLGATGRMGSLWTLLGQEIHRRTGRDIVVLSHGVGGATIDKWTEQSSFGYLKRLLDNADQLSKKGLTIQTVIYHQGEGDLAEGTSPKTYTQTLSTVFETIQNRLPGDQRFLLYGVSRCYGQDSPELVLAQQQVAADREDTQFLFSTDELGDPYRYDGCHFNHHGMEAIVKRTLPFFLPPQG